MTSSKDWQHPKHSLREHKLGAKRSFSQNFLTDRRVAEAIVRALEITSTEDKVVEFGPGTGSLTSLIVAEGVELWAVERDREMAEVLRGRFGAMPQFHLVEDDAARVDMQGWVAGEPGRLKLIGNLPYASTGAILRNLMQQSALLERAVVMMQREVFERLRASPGTKAYGALTLFLGAHYRVEKVLDVAPGAFFPPPKVRSTVVRLWPRQSAAQNHWEAFERVVRQSFSSRRKTLRTSLKQAGFPSPTLEMLWQRSGIDGGQRPETLDEDAFLRMAEILYPPES